MLASSAPKIDAGDLLNLIEEVSAELRSGRRFASNLDSRLEEDLGLDSLARLELLLRIEKRFGVTLSERDGLGAETPRALLAALSVAKASAPLAPALASPPTVATAPAVDLPRQTATLLEALQWFAEHAPDRVHIDLHETSDSGTPITYGQLWAEARRLASGLCARGIRRNDSVALMLPTSRDFFVAFLGIQLAGAVPVPIYPPFRASQLEAHLSRQARILENARAVLLISSRDTDLAARWLRTRLLELRDVLTVEDLSSAVDVKLDAVRPSDVALIQYTSGSTGDPKGVVLTHANLIANVRAIGEAARIVSTDVVVSWLPLYHDMGLIGAWLGSLFHGCRFVIMSPTLFLAQPASWLRALHTHGGTLAAAPNFAYEICASRVQDADLVGLDLRAWRLALNGSEPVSPNTIERFAHRFAAHGFRREAMTPVYGLAENAVALTFTPAGRGPRLDSIDRRTFETEGRVSPATETAGDALVVVSSGAPIPGHEVRVVDDLGRELPDRQLGAIQFRGPSSTSGYFRNPAATRALFDGGWLVTGDLGYVADGEVFVTGRSKDVIIRAGRHVFPYEIEEAVGAIPAIRRGGVAVFPVLREARGTEDVVIVAETREQHPARLAELRATIESRTMALLGTAPEDVVLVPPRTIPKTSSGKTRRVACREMYERGTLGRARSPRRQKLALLLRLSKPATRRAMRSIAAIAYAAWFWFWLGVLAIPGWGLAVALAGANGRWRAVSGVARTFFRMAGIRLRIEGAEYLEGGPRILVMNHASYLDAIVLTALLPPGFSLVAKRELERSLLLRRALRGMGVVFVERFDLERAAHEVDNLEAVVRQGRSLVIFPEGTNRRTPGLFPFHLGAFSAAARLGVPIVPAGIVGSRAVLRADQWFPRRAPITVVLRAPIVPGRHDWAGVVELRDRARGEVAAAASEPLVT
jgi:1-acyl-sn-glycerol-3-phosphate acyltransferase